jgi:hypothetical protein
MKAFTQTAACTSGLHCATCRSLEGGRKIRTNWSKRFIMPNEAPDFACPFGKPWGWQPPSRGLGDTLAKVIQKVTLGKVKPCGKCKERQAKLNQLVPYSDTEGKRSDSRSE